MRLSIALLFTAGIFVGCAEKRMVTLTAHPSDALIRIDDQDKGRGTVTQQIIFKDDRDTHKVSASKPGYKERIVVLSKDEKRTDVRIDLRPETRVFNIVVEPVPAIVSINGQPISSQPTGAVSKELEFTLDDTGKWTKYTISAARQGFQPAETTVSWLDPPKPSYTLLLEAMKKDLSITTNPPGAQIFLDDQPLGTSPVHDVGRTFPFDVANSQFAPRALKAVKPGYDAVVREISWDDGKTDYNIDLAAKTKGVRIVTDPPGGTVSIAGS